MPESTRTDEPALVDCIEIAASPARVWELVSDICRMPEWSPQVVSTRLRRGHDHVAVGAQFTNLNTEGELKWTTHGEVVELRSERTLTFRIEENGAFWSFLLQPTARGGTQLTERRETPNGISQLAAQYADTYLGGHETFTQTMRAGIRRTLERIKAAAES